MVTYPQASWQSVTISELPAHLFRQQLRRTSRPEPDQPLSETPAESEYLIANLLAPVGAGTLSQTISQQEYSKLFERDRLGVTSSTEYLSRGAWIEKGAQFGTFGNSAYAFEASYRTDPGQRPDNDFEETELHLHLKRRLHRRIRFICVPSMIMPKTEI
jgi:hypothetical protein